MKANKWIVIAFIAILLSTLIMTAKPATATVPDKPVSEDMTPKAAPVSTDWIPDQKVSDTIQDESNPSIATTGDNEVWVAYESDNTVTGKTEIKVARSTDGGAKWSVMYTKSITGYNLYKPSIAIDPYLNWVYVVYERMFSTSDYDIFLVRYNGTGWFDEYLTNDGWDDHNPSIVCEYNYYSSNYVFVTWERREAAQDIEIYFTRSYNHADTWSTVSSLTPHGVGALTHQPSMTYTYSSAGARIYIAYRDNDQIEGMYKISLLTSSNEGQSWTTRDITSYGYNNVREPSITATHGGAAIIAAWIYAFTPTDDDIYYSYSQDSGFTWSAIYGMATSGRNEVHPHLTVDGMGRTTNYIGYIHATYEVQETVGSRYNGIYYRSAGNATLSVWSTPVQVADDNAYVPWGDFSVADRAITTVHDTVPVIVWTDGRLVNQDIFATTLGGKYTINTSPAGLQVSVDGALYTAPQIFYLAYRSVHTLSVTSPQGQYSFLSWSDSGAQSHSLTANTLSEQTITANFVTLGLKELTSYYWTSNTVINSVVSGDVDNDGFKEIVTGGNYWDGTRNVAQLIVWNGANLAVENIKTWYWTDDTDINSVALGDVDGDGKSEIVTGGSYNDGTRTNAQLCVWDGTTLALENVKTWYWTYSTDISSVSVADVDGDAKNEVVTGGSYHDGSRSVAQLCVWDGATLALENVKTWYWVWNTHIACVAVGDVDGDGKSEIVTGGSYSMGQDVAQLCVWDGATLALENVKTWQWYWSTFIACVAVGDVDGDGKSEIVTGSSYYDQTGPMCRIAQLRVWEGATLVMKNDKAWYWTGNTFIWSVFVGDVDGDGKNEIVTGGSYNDGIRTNAQLCVWDGTTTAIKNFKTWYWTSNTEINSVAIGNVVGDNQVEVITGGYFNDGTRNNAQLAVWGMM